MQMFWFGNEKKGEAPAPFSLTPGPLLSSFRKLHEQRPMVLQGEGSRMLRKWRA